MIRTKIHPEKGVLNIILKDRVTAVQFDELLSSLPSLFRGLSPDFIFLHDFSEVVEMEFDCTKEIGELMDSMVEAGVGEVLRVMPDPSKDIGCGIMAAFHYPASLPVLVFKDSAAAWEHISKSPRHHETS